MKLEKKQFIHSKEFWMNKVQENCQDCDMYQDCERAKKNHSLDKKSGFYMDEEGYSVELECRKRTASAIILEEGDFPSLFAIEKQIPPPPMRDKIIEYIKNVQNDLPMHNLLIESNNVHTSMRLACSVVNNLHLTNDMNVNFVTADQFSSYARSADALRKTLEDLIQYSDILVIFNAGLESGCEKDKKKLANGEYKQSQIVLNDIVTRRAYSYSKTTIIVTPALIFGKYTFREIYMPTTIEMIDDQFIQVKIYSNKNIK